MTLSILLKTHNFGCKVGFQLQKNKCEIPKKLPEIPKKVPDYPKKDA